jgi:hypothetical protein
MTAAEAGTQQHEELERIEAWRADMLRRAGYDRRSADKLATRHDIDLHRAADLLRRGCPQELALSILL